MNWVQTDMTFDNMPFSKLVDHLSKRYGVEFSFENSQLKDCPFTGRFTGTENLEEILNVLAEISGTQYQINSNHVLIQGNNCL
jgi:ferric-dicitrate binding protein FerR (iron transport regulator)